MVVAPVDDTPLRVAATAYMDELSISASTVAEKMDKLADESSLRLWVFGLVGTAVAGVLAIYIGARLTRSLSRMAVAAEQVAQGDWESIRPLPERTELGALSRSLYAMTNQLRSTQENLEKQIGARTKELTRRTSQLEAAAEVAREASAIRDLTRLLNQVVHLVAERFDVYHVGVFLVDEAREYVVLYAANSEGGRKMLARGYKLRVGAEGIVGWVANAGQPRIAFDVGADQHFVRDPELPQTRSEATLALRIRERVIGVLDVQSVQPSAFTPDDLGVLQIVADQIALAVENARLFESSQQTLQAMNRLYSRESQEAWQQRLGEHPVAFRYTRLGTQMISEQASGQAMVETSQIRSDPASGVHELLVPVAFRGQVMGQLRLRRDADQASWVQADAEIVEQAVAQIVPALENARLLEEVQSRAAREQMVNIITSRVRSSITMETILQNAVRELGMALGASRAYVQIGLDPKQGDQQQKGGSDEKE
jgi:GAF domain-containing protein/HAMP domain-containing protein